MVGRPAGSDTGQIAARTVLSRTVNARQRVKVREASVGQLQASSLRDLQLSSSSAPPITPPALFEARVHSLCLSVANQPEPDRKNRATQTQPAPVEQLPEGKESWTYSRSHHPEYGFRYSAGHTKCSLNKD